LLVIAVLLSSGVFAFAAESYTVFRTVQPVSDKNPLDTLLEKAVKSDFKLQDTPEYLDLVRAGTFCSYQNPEELRTYLKEENSFKEYDPEDGYIPQPGDMLFYISARDGAQSAVFLGKGLSSVPKHHTVIHIEYPEYEKLCYLYLRDECFFNDTVCYGIMANMYCESEFLPTAEEKTGQHGYGICQWTGDRRIGLESWCRRNNRNSSSLYAQLDYMQYELDSTEFAQLVRMMRNCSRDSDGAYDVAHIFCLVYEDPDNSQELAETRGAIAQWTFWNKYP